MNDLNNLSDLAAEALKSAAKTQVSDLRKSLVSDGEREKRKQEMTEKSPLGLFFGWLFAEDPATAIYKRMKRQFLPDLRNFLADTIIGGLEQSIRGNTSRTSYSTRGSSVTRMSDNPSWYTGKSEEYRATGNTPLMEEIIFHSPRDVTVLVQELYRKYLRIYGRVSVNQLNEHLGRRNTNTMSDSFGWYSLEGVRPRQTPDGWWAAEFPEPVEFIRR